jgi:hypothetical protein
MRLTLNRLVLHNKFQAKTLFRYQRFGFLNNFNKTDKIIDKNVNRVEEVYQLEETLPFVEGKYLLSSSVTTEVNTFRSFHLYVITPINVFFGYKLVKSLIMLRPVRSIFWGILFLGTCKVNYGIKNNLHHFIDKVYLLEDGHRSEITFHISSESLVTENIKIRKANQKEVMFIMTLAPHIFDKFVPIIIENKIYFISKENDISNKPVFSAVMNGNTISMRKDKCEKVIDIK